MTTLARKNQNKPGIILPKKWCEKIENILIKNYQNHCNKQDKTFSVTALTYPDEFYVGVSYLNPDKQEIVPVSYIVSLDLDANKDSDPDKYINTLIDSMGVFFDEYFSIPEWDEYISSWTEAEFKKLKFFYIISRENLSLTLQAEQLLNQ